MVNMVSKVDVHLQQLEQLAIHKTTKVQPHGLLFVLSEPELRILQTSNNTQEILGIPAEELLGSSLEDVFDSFQVEPLKLALTQESWDYLNPTKLWARLTGDNYNVFDAVFHRNSDRALILELEPTDSVENISFLSFYNLAKSSMNEVQTRSSLQDFCQLIVQEVRKLTGYDRVMLYRFDEFNHGDVIAEDKIPEMESYLGLHYPESDIPQPARRLFTRHPIRLIPDVNALPVDLFPSVHPETEQAIDLTCSILRSPYDCHLQYLRNMGVGACLTISLIKDGSLWGLIACHHRSPKWVPYEIRKASEFLGRMVFSDIAAKEENEDYGYHLKLSQCQTRLVDVMSVAPTFVEGLVEDATDLLALTDAGGCAIYYADRLVLLGETPNEQEVTHLLQWLKNREHNDDEVFLTQSLPSLYADAQNFKDVASGLLAIPIARRNYLLWFRPEVLHTVNWGGDPSKAYETSHVDGKVKLSPRKSFDLWKETVRLKALTWKPVEVRAALALRNAIVNIILRQADELAELAENLKRSNADLKKFAYVASHDLQEPLNQVANYVQLLEMRYGRSLDGEAKEFIGFAVEGVSLMQTLIDDVLAYSKVDVQSAEIALTDAPSSFERAKSNLRVRIAETEAVITSDRLPSVMADSTQLMQVFQNLLSNALKFRSVEPPRIHVTATRLEDSWLFSIKDNGIGVDPQFRDRIFVIFQRLHTRDEYTGTGMGLAICKKIVEGHRGQIWVESEPGQGANFFFTLPVGGYGREYRW